MKSALVVLALASLSALWQQATRPTNSTAAGRRGQTAWESQQYEQAAAEFGVTAAIDASPQNLFNLGTAQVATGRREDGSSTLTGAMADPALRARALFNRGNSALAANAFEHAVRDYTDALKIAPADRDAKRNLEIALQRQQQEEQRRRRQQEGGQNQQQAQSPQPEQNAPQSPAEGEEEQGEANAEAILRSVQQQEQEELERMKRARGDSRRVGW